MQHFFSSSGAHSYGAAARRITTGRGGRGDETAMSSKIRDMIDRELIALLQGDARRSATEIARILGLARSTIHERIARLEREGVILGYSAIVAPNFDGEVTRALIFIDLLQKQTSQVIGSLGGFPEIVACHSIDGPSDIVCWVEVPQLEDLDALLSEISQIRSVEHVTSQVILATKFDRSTSALTRRNGRDQGPLLVSVR